MVFMLLGILVTPLKAEELVMEFKGLDIVANLEIPQGKKLRGSTVVLFLHDALETSSNPTISTTQQSLTSAGILSLGINLSYGLDQRVNNYDCSIEQNHRYQDALEELDIWVKWLKKQKVKKVVLAGFGRGGNQIALFLRTYPKSGIKKIILISPLSGSFAKIENGFQNRFRQPLQNYLSKARKMLEADEGDVLMENVPFLTCPKAVVTAKTFENYYTPNPDFETTSVLSALAKVKALTVVGEYDPDAYDIQSGMQTFGSATGIQTISIPGANKRFEGDYLHQMINTITPFIKTGKLASHPNR